MASETDLELRWRVFRQGHGGGDLAALAEELLEAQRVADASEVIGAGLRVSPNDGRFQLLDGRRRLAQRDLLGAQAALLKSARSMPSDARPFRWLGEVLLERGDLARAGKVLGRALALAPGDPHLEALVRRAAGESVPPPPEPPPPEPPAAASGRAFDDEERTVVRSDLTEELRSLARGAEDAVTQPVDELFTRNADASSLVDDFDDDEPTRVAELSSASSPGVEGGEAGGTQRAGPFPPPPAPPFERPGRTVRFGSPETPAAPKQPPVPAAASPRGLPTEAFGEAAVASHTARGQSDGRRSEHTSTSPGAAMAPRPSPARRVPPSARLRGAGTSEAGGAERRSPGAGEPSHPPLHDPFAPGPSALSRGSGVGVESFDEQRAENGSADAARELVPAPAPRPEALAPDPFASAAAPSRLPEPASVDAPTDDRKDTLTSTGPQPPSGRAGGDDAQVDAVLAMLRDHGLFEETRSEPGAWADRGLVRAQRGPADFRARLWMGAAWVLALGVAAGGWWGWGEHSRRRQARAAELLEEARAACLSGNHADLVSAERSLREAQELDPRGFDAPALTLLVQAQMALEDGGMDAGAVRVGVSRAERLLAHEPGHALPSWLDPTAGPPGDSTTLQSYLEAARAVIAAAGGDDDAPTRVGQLVETASGMSPADPGLQYLAGRLGMRRGAPEAEALLESASQADGAPVAARLALAELRYDARRREEATELVDALLRDHPEHLRVRLWQSFISADEAEPEEALGVLAALQPTVTATGAASDAVLLHLTRARLLRRQGERDAAGEAVDAALRAGTSDPAWLGRLAREARRAGRLLSAERAARAAVRGAPTNGAWRVLLARVLLARRNGLGVLTTLDGLDLAEPGVLELRARGALMAGRSAVLEEVAGHLDAAVNAEGGASVALRALLIRVRGRLGGSDGLLSAARELETEAPGDADAALALGEAALRVLDAETAQAALSRAVRAAPTDPEAHYLLGRAHRIAGDGEGARASLERALSLAPEHADARLALGRLLLDLGDYDAAAEAYEVLSRGPSGARGRARTLAARLGRVEALLGLGRVDDAGIQLDGLPTRDRELPATRVARARLALARSQPSEALSSLRPLLAGDEASPTLVALYGDALLAAGQNQPASEAYARALEMNSALPEALLGQAELAVRSERDGPALEVLEALASALETRIRPPVFHARRLILLGRAHLLAGRSGLDDARSSLREAAALESAPAEVHFWLGEALAGANSPESRAAYRRYLELAPDGSYASRARRATR